jgi:hypothetical protein
MEGVMKTEISGKEAARVAEDMAKPGPIRVVDLSEAQEAPSALVPSPGSELDRKVPPRVRKLLPRNDQLKAPTPDLEGHRKRLREALGNTLSDEFVEVILGKLVEALRPGLYDQLEEATLNAALATIDSMRPRSELQALLAVQIIATGFAGLRFLRQSHRNIGTLTDAHRDVIGKFAARYRLPAVYPFPFFVRSGGLISYGTDIIDLYRRAAGYVDRILKGEKPADLPVQQPTKIQLAINLKAAKALGLEVPPTSPDA